MLSRKYFFYVFFFISFLVGLVLFYRSIRTVGPLVAITQIAPHPSLDEIRRGITECLELAGIGSDQILFQNAQGSPATALQIAQKFVSLKPKVIVPITTPSAQAAYSVAKGAHIPVIFSAVSDPRAAKLYDPNGENKLVAGVSDMSPVKEQVQLIRHIFPTLTVVGVIYNAGEANSVALIDAFEKEAKVVDVKIIHSTVTGTNDVSTAVMNLVGKVGVIYIPNDNTAISAFESIVKITNKYKMAVFTADPESVTRGALGCIAHNQYNLGKKTGELIIQYLIDHKSIEQLGIQKPDRIELTLNLKTASSIGIPLPQDLVRKATFLIKE